MDSFPLCITFAGQQLVSPYNHVQKNKEILEIGGVAVAAFGLFKYAPKTALPVNLIFLLSSAVLTETVTAKWENKNYSKYFKLAGWCHRIFAAGVLGDHLATIQRPTDWKTALSALNSIRCLCFNQASSLLKLSQLWFEISKFASKKPTLTRRFFQWRIHNGDYLEGLFTKNEDKKTNALKWMKFFKSKLFKHKEFTWDKPAKNSDPIDHLKNLYEKNNPLPKTPTPSLIETLLSNIIEIVPTIFQAYHNPKTFIAGMVVNFAIGQRFENLPLQVTLLLGENLHPQTAAGFASDPIWAKALETGAFVAGLENLPIACGRYSSFFAGYRGLQLALRARPLRRIFNQIASR